MESVPCIDGSFEPLVIVKGFLKSSQLNSSSFISQKILVDGKLVIDSKISLSDCQVVLTKGSSIDVESTGDLSA